MTTTLEPSTAPVDATERPLPWEGITTGSVTTVTNTASLDDLLTEADLNWEVAKRPLWRRLSSGLTVQADNTYEVYRTDTEEQLGTVKSHYEVYQNRDAFEFAARLVDADEARWADAGLQGNGWRVFVAMELTEQFTVLDGDPHSLYVFMQTSHDGSAAVRGFMTPIRFFCTNQVEAMKASAHARFNYAHTVNLAKRLEEAQHTFADAKAYVTELKDLAERLVKVEVPESTLRVILKDVIPDGRARKDAIVDGIVQNYLSSSTLEAYRGNGWGALNAATEYMDHVITRRNGNSRFEQVMGGEGAKLRHGLTERLLQVN